LRQTVVRRARRSDAKGFLELLAALAEFEKLDPPDQAARDRIVEDVFARRRLGLFVATRRGRLVGYALYFYSYSSFLAKPTLYLEDIFVLSEMRGSGAGTQLFRRCLEEAAANGCGRMEWAVLAWNRKAVGFYRKLGARRLKEWHAYRLDSTQFARTRRKLGASWSPSAAGRRAAPRRSNAARSGPLP
jgi:GNAT superfamily N-acetyltransferase